MWVSVNDMPQTNPLGLVIDQHRQDAGHSINSLATAAHIASSTLQRKLVTGALTVPELSRLAEALNTTAAALLDEAEKSAA